MHAGSRLSRLAAVALVLGLTLALARADAGAADEVIASATGGGTFIYAGTTPIHFAFGAIARTDGSASGRFHHRFSFGGYHYEYWGTVTCLAVDSFNHRAWVGGVLTKVATDDPTSTQQPGDDAWFRVLDESEQTGASEADNAGRSTAMGFKGAIPSSAAYCALRLWPAGNARTWPVSEGQITVR